MAQGTARSEGRVAADPETIRAAMANTRAHLTRELGALKSRVFGTPTPARKGRKSTVAQKTKSATRSKSGSRAKSSSRSTASSAGKKTGSRNKQSGRGQQSRQGIVAPAKKVLGKMLAGAAVGAVKGAAEAVVPEEELRGTGNKSK